MEVYFSGFSELNGFDHHYSRSYSDQLSLLLANCSNLAYEDLEQNNIKLKELGFELHAVIDNKTTGTYAYIAKHEKFAVLCFRGTEKNFSDILTDLKIRFFQTEKGKLHSGFFNAYLSIDSEIKHYLQHLQHLPLYITGHSLGGALAIIAMTQLPRKNIVACYTYGCPKIGDDKFVRSHSNAPIYSIMNCLDIVTYIPWTLFKNYQSIGYVRYLSPNSRLLTQRCWTDELKCFINYHLKHDLDELFLCHRINEYCKKLAIIAQNKMVDERALDIN